MTLIFRNNVAPPEPAKPKTVEEVRRLFAYHSWATSKLLDVVGTLTPEEWSRDVAGTYGSVRNTLVHTLSAEWGWLDRARGWPRGDKLSPDNYPTPQSLIEQWARVEEKMNEFLSEVSAEQLNGVVEFSIADKAF